MSALTVSDLTLDDLRAMIGGRADLIAALNREAVKDKSYQDFPMGQEALAYLRAKRRRLTEISYSNYEGFLSRLAKYFTDLELADFEMPIGATRMEEFLDDQWGNRAAGTYNVAHAIYSDFFKWQVRRGRMNSNPMLVIERARKRTPHREVFSNDQRRGIIASAESRRDRLALMLLLDYALRKGGLRNVQIKHFDYQRKQLTVFTKGGKVMTIPIPDPAFWTELEHYILETEARPSDYLMCLIKPVPYGTPDKDGKRPVRLLRFPEKQMGAGTTHRWWYHRLEDAGIVATGETSGEKMHKARHTAGQRVLENTGDLKLTQKLLGHASIQTTGDIYVDYDMDAFAARLARALSEDNEDIS